MPNIKCPKCQTLLFVDDQLIGQDCICTCGHQFHVENTIQKTPKKQIVAQPQRRIIQPSTPHLDGIQEERAPRPRIATILAALGYLSLVAGVIILIISIIEGSDPRKTDALDELQTNLDMIYGSSLIASSFSLLVSSTIITLLSEISFYGRELFRIKKTEQKSNQ